MATWIAPNSVSPRAWASAPCSGDGRRSQPTLPTITIRRKKERESVLRTLFCLLRKKYIWSISQQTWSPFHNFCTKISMRKPYGIYKQSFKRKSCGWNAGCFVIVAKLTFGPILVLIWADPSYVYQRDDEEIFSQKVGVVTWVIHS